MSAKLSISRRNFLQTSGSAVALSAPMVFSSRVWGANDTVNLGVIGTGRRAGGLMNDFRRAKNAQYVAISDVNKPRMDRVAGERNWKKYQDFRQLLEDDDVDAVIVATPDHWHALCSIYACMAGKDVYVEKPMTLTIAEGRAMVKAARKHDRVVQCGSQQRSSVPCRVGCELVRNQRLGKVHTVHAANYLSPWDQPFPSYPIPDGLDWDMWLGMNEDRGYHDDIYTPRAKPGWISIMPYSGGEVTGWGAHGFDIIQWGLGTDESGPVEVWSDGDPRFPDLNPVVHMRYANGAELITDNEGPMGGGKFVGDKGAIVVDRGRYETDPEDIGAPIKDDEIHLEVSHDHQQNFIDCVRSRKRPIADVETGHRSATICHLVNIARWTRRRLEWDPEQEVFVNDKDANEYLDRPRRSPWELPNI